MLPIRLVAARVVRRSSVPPSSPRLLLSARPRFLSTTTPRRAAEAPTPQEIAAALEKSPIYQKVMKRPEAIEALKNLAKHFEKQGIDMSTGKPPSMLQMSKLLLNSEFREASTKVMEEFQKAGVDVKDKATLEEIQSVIGKIKSG